MLNARHLHLDDHLARPPSERAETSIRGQPDDGDSDESQAGANDRAVFDQFILDNQPAVTRLVERLLAWPQETSTVDDVVQEVFLAAWLKRGQFRGDAKSSTWLGRIAINKTRNHIRQQATWKRLVDAFASLLNQQTNNAVQPSLVINEKQDHLRCALTRLRLPDREIIVLHYLEERTIEEIARLIGKKRNTIEARLSRARKRLKELMEAQEHARSKA